MWGSLQHSVWVTAVTGISWLYAAVSVTHYFTLFFCIGTIALVDLRVLGIADRNQTIVHLAHQVLPWTWIGFTLAMLSGFVLFATDATKYVPDGLFQLKMLMIVLAVVFTVFVQMGVPKWNQSPAAPLSAKGLTLVSLLLWLGSILAAVDISSISGIG